MLPSLLATLAAATAIYWSNPIALPVASPLLLAWLLAPELAHLISRPIRSDDVPLTATQQQKLRNLARRTWFYFEQFVNPDENWLPPDHFQEAPRGVVAHRTSPTNLGLLLLTTIAAYDFGYIKCHDAGFAAGCNLRYAGPRLKRYRGHFLNWTDTRSLESLQPRYVSTVDSGNLAACLLVLRQICLSIGQTRAWRWGKLARLSGYAGCSG